ncbi:tetratricopeptide repeat protein [Rubritalea profundi]|uniref:Outer membrane lipoprotein BamD-like domain-containing protein n=1 Tax=Rubritalea profundi TaxID=1658618 RepID=A0A2S7U251_9BACT|nr:hypothetical protein [Rubritalea profundi]PQJ28253.1 hypothetical protein BSZ32_06860 [Rubritalea profundi]
MKTHHSLTIAFTLAGASLVGMAPTQVSAQDIQEAVPLGIQAMNEKKWEQAQGIFAKIIESYGGDRGKRLFGGRFGIIYYNKGYAEQKMATNFKGLGGEENLAKAAEYSSLAKESFTKSYAIPSDDKSKNIYHKKSLLCKGQAHQALEEYEEAITSYKKFIAERGPRDKFNRGMYQINMAICHFRLDEPQIKEGIVFFDTSLKNKDRWKTPNTAIVSAFQALTRAMIATKNERALIDFLNQNRSAITLRPYQMVQFGPFFQKLATDALTADMQQAAYSLFALIPGTEVALSDLGGIKEKLALYPGLAIKEGSDFISKERISKWYSDLRDKDRSGDPPEVLALSALAFTHESNGNVRGAYRAYEQLELYFRDSTRREVNLYNLVRTSAVADELSVTVGYAQKFLAKYPESKYREPAANMMLSLLFANSKYEESELIAGEMIADLPKPSPLHDICLHVLGGSKFYLGKFAEARPHLEEHLKLYEKSKYSISANYFEASNLAQLQLWDQAGVKLKKFLKTYPDSTKNVFLAYALNDLANVHSYKGEDEIALENIARIESEFHESNVANTAYNLKGSILQNMGQLDEAKKYFLKVCDSVEDSDSDVNQGESLYRLVNLLGAEKIDKKPNANMKEALPYYDRFWKNHQNSPFKGLLAVAGMPALIEAGRDDEALSNLQLAITDMAERKKFSNLEKTIATYTVYYLQAQEKKKISPSNAISNLKLHYYTFPGIDKKNIRALALLRIAVIGVYEKSLKIASKEGNEALVSRIQAGINATFKDLKTAYPVEKLSDSVLIRIGDYLRTKSSAPRQALPYYQERLKHTQPNGRISAEFGIADIYGRAGSNAEMTKAIGMMQDVIKQKDTTKKNRAKAHSSMVQIYAKQGNWNKVVEEGVLYLEEHTKERTAIQQLLAQAYDEQKNYLKCIAINSNLAGNNRSNWDVSVPAMNRATELMWAHGTAAKDGRSKQQLAYEVAARYIKSSRAAFDEHKDEMSEIVRTTWKRIDARVMKWEDSGKIQTFAEMEKNNK